VFNALHGVTQGDMVSPMIFNVVVDCILKVWRYENAVVMAAVTVIFYADDGTLSSTDSTLLQDVIEQLTILFARVGLCMNATKMKVMIADPSKVQLGLSSPYKL
jgi:hypothetical protein